MANTVDRTVKVWDGVAVRGNNWVYVTLGFGVTKFRSNLIFNYWRNPISRNNLILSILNIFRILNKSIYIYKIEKYFNKLNIFNILDCEVF